MITVRTASAAIRSWIPHSVIYALSCVLAVRLLAAMLGFILWLQGLLPSQVPSYTQFSYPEGSPVFDWLLGVWLRHDAFYYLSITQSGYSVEDGTVVFPPLFPLLVRWIGMLLGEHDLLAAVIISTAASIGAFALLYRLAEDEIGAESARRAVFYLLIFPTSYALFGAYAEPLMLLLVLLSFWFARRKKWAWAGFASFLAALTRLQASVLVLPLGYLYWRDLLVHKRKPGMDALAVFAAPAAWVGYHLYLNIQSLPSVQTAYREDWFSVPVFPGKELIHALVFFFQGDLDFQRGLALFLVLVFMGLTIEAFRKLPAEYGLFMAATLFLVFIRQDLLGRPLLSASRHMMSMFPGFMILGLWGKDTRIHRFVFYPSIFLSLLMMGAFFMGGFPE